MGHASDEDKPTHHYTNPLQACVRLASLPSEVTVLCWLKTICLHCGLAPNRISIWEKKHTIPSSRLLSSSSASSFLSYLATWASPVSDRACWLKKLAHVAGRCARVNKKQSSWTVCFGIWIEDWIQLSLDIVL
ncbi:hypothetical protein BJY00DRAFT_283034 [Aspergillus carlsbadensis]|nr:hypothetical protein BJY00DRAFT_283034 [Aspergillus carlsbadensis]